MCCFGTGQGGLHWQGREKHARMGGACQGLASGIAQVSIWDDFVATSISSDRIKQPSRRLEMTY